MPSNEFITAEKKTSSDLLQYMCIMHSRTVIDFSKFNFLKNGIEKKRVQNNLWGSSAHMNDAMKTKR